MTESTYFERRAMGKQVPVYDDNGNVLFHVHSATGSIGVAKRAKWKSARWAYHAPATDAKLPTRGWVEVR
jgi:hypothetical protein